MLGTPTRSSTRSDPRHHSIWEKANPNYVRGEPLSETELERARPYYVALRAWYMKEYVEGRTKGPCAKYKKEHFCCTKPFRYYTLALEDSFDLFTLDG
jgi:hypothetical protein